MNVRRANDRDVDAIVSIHQSAFPQFFLTSLGARFLRRFYGAVVRDSAALAFVGLQDDAVAGFVVGTTRPAKFFRKLLLSQGMGFCLDALGAWLRRPWSVGRRLLGALTYRGEAPDLQANAALVSSIAVLPSAAGSGLATALLNAFCEAAAASGATSVYLLTDRDDNPGANRFYLKAGFTLQTELTRSGKRPMNRYIRHLHGAVHDERRPQADA